MKNILILSLLIFSDLTLASSSLLKEIESLAIEISKDIPDGSRIAVTEFVNLHGEVNELGIFISEELITEISSNSTQLTVIERRRIGIVLEEQKLTTSELFDPEAVKKLGKLLNVDAIVTGSMTNLGEELRINTRMISTQTGEVQSSANGSIPLTGVIENMISSTKRKIQSSTPNSVANNKTPPLTSNLPADCEEVKLQHAASSSGKYTIDPDGGTTENSFEVHCEMDLLDGGWTLVASHKDGLDKIDSKEYVSKTSFGVIKDEYWKTLRSHLSTGMMFVDEHGKVSSITNGKLYAGNCHSLLQVESLNSFKNKDRIWHNENSGCDGRNSDYSQIVLGVKRGKSFEKNGASLYQMSTIKFDIWPYSSKNASYDEQNLLFYYVK